MQRVRTQVQVQGDWLDLSSETPAFSVICRFLTAHSASGETMSPVVPAGRSAEGGEGFLMVLSGCVVGVSMRSVSWVPKRLLTRVTPAEWLLGLQPRNAGQSEGDG